MEVSLVAAPPARTLPASAGDGTPLPCNHPHTIDRWDDATGENLIEQIAAVMFLAGLAVGTFFG